MAGACLFFLLLSLGGIAAVLATGEVTGVDSLLMLMVCGGMALLFAWLTLSALRAAGILGGHAESAAPAAAAAPEASTASRAAEGK